MHQMWGAGCRVNKSLDHLKCAQHRLQHLFLKATQVRFRTYPLEILELFLYQLF